MKNFKTIFLTLLLSIGFMLPSCEKEAIITGCEDMEDYRYFDIKGLAISYLEKDTLDSFKFLSEDVDTIIFSDLAGIYVEYEVDYHANVAPFSFIGSMMACTFLAGYDGSKTEQLVDLSIITLNDFDDTHLANSSINDLIIVDGDWVVKNDTWVQETPSDLSDYLANQTGLIRNPYLRLALKKAPEINPELRFSIKVELSTGESYQEESRAIYIKE